jgi:hypothetical protein
MSDEEFIEIYNRMARHVYDAFADIGKWIGRVWALLVAWVVTYVLLIIAAVRLGEEWLVYASMLPIAVHFILEPIFIRMEEKTFGRKGGSFDDEQS